MNVASLVADPLIENPRAFAKKVAGALAGKAVKRADVVGFINSDFDPFLNHLFARGTLSERAAAEALDGRPGFVWLRHEPDSRGARLAVMQGMVADIATPPVESPVESEIGEARTAADLEAWHDVYSEVLGADPRSLRDWHRVHAALGPSGEGSLLLLLARVGGLPAATGAVFFDHDVAGLYCFTTRESMRRRGLGSALVHASHAAALARGVEHAVLQASPSGRPVYARAGYRAVRAIPVLRFARMARSRAKPCG
jgi:GNAT superfamily N-acetyltransferase